MKELSLHILDIAENSVSAGSSDVSVSICESEKDNMLKIKITDDGRGMSNETLRMVTDPFYTTRTTRKIGMGIPLFKQAAESCGGNFQIESSPGKGTVVKVSMVLNHIDRQPIGDIAGVIVQLVSSYPAIDFVYVHKTDSGLYEFKTVDIKEVLGDVPLNDLKVVKFIRVMIRENIQALYK